MDPAASPRLTEELGDAVDNGFGKVFRLTPVGLTPVGLIATGLL